MRDRFLFGIGLLAFVAAGAGSAVAADIAARPMGPPPAAAPVVVPEWAGFYIGLNGGGGDAHNSFDSQFADSLFFSGIPPFISPFTTTLNSVLPPNVSPSGGIFGGQAGYNWQWGPVVGGLELDFDGADIHGSSTFFQPHAFLPGTNVGFTNEFKLDELASVRARLGYLIFPNWLLYGTAGLGYGHTRFNSSAAWSPSPFLNFSQFSESDQNLFGWVVGAGLEWQFFPHWLLRGEWLHYDFGSVTQPEASGLFLLPTENVNVRTTVDVGRAAISYKF
jgi:outer membrane immunogenic protein